MTKTPSGNHASTETPKTADPKTPAVVQLTRNAAGHLRGETMTGAEADRMGLTPKDFTAFN